MPPWFIIGGGAVLFWLLSQLPKSGQTGEAGGAGAGDEGSGGGSGAVEGEYVIPGDPLNPFGAQIPGYEQYQGGESGGGDDSGFGESSPAYGYDYFGTPIPPENASQPLGGYYGASLAPTSMPGFNPDTFLQPSAPAPATPAPAPTPAIPRGPGGKPILMD